MELILLCHRNQNTSLLSKTIALPTTFKCPQRLLSTSKRPIEFWIPQMMEIMTSWRTCLPLSDLFHLTLRPPGALMLSGDKVAFQSCTEFHAAFHPDPLTGGLRLTGRSRLSCSEHQTAAFPLVSWFMGCLGVVHRNGIVGTHNYDVCIFPKRLCLFPHSFLFHHHPASR